MKSDREFTRELQYSLPKDIVSSVRNLGSSALELAFVARGGLEANIQVGLSSYDFAAGTLLVQEAGGKITTLEGKPWKFPDNHFIASNGVFHDVLVEEVKRQKNKLGIK
jgi:myo-inositol-1(or 4)-monophosphatase